MDNRRPARSPAANDGGLLCVDETANGAAASTAPAASGTFAGKPVLATIAAATGAEEALRRNVGGRPVQRVRNLKIRQEAQRDAGTAAGPSLPKHLGLLSASESAIRCTAASGCVDVVLRSCESS